MEVRYVAVTLKAEGPHMYRRTNVKDCCGRFLSVLGCPVCVVLFRNLRSATLKIKYLQLFLFFKVSHLFGCFISVRLSPLLSSLLSLLK